MNEIYNRDLVDKDRILNKKKSWRYCLALLFGMFLSVASFGQVSGYTFTQTSGTFTAVSGGTSLIAGGVDSGASPVTDIGFPFTFDGVSYTQFSASSNGWLRLGGTAANAYTSTPLSTSGAGPAIAFMARDGKTNGAVVYTLTGTAPNRVLTVEYPNHYLQYNSLTNTLNAQIKLYETSNVVQIVYGYSAKATSYTGQVGLVGTANTNFATRTTTTNWSATTAGAANNSTMTWSSTVGPSDGLTFTWTPPVASTVPNCVALPTTPANNATGVVSKTFTWPAATGLPNGYKFYLGSDIGATNLINGTDIGAVLTYNAAVSLSPSTQYYWRAVPYNAIGDAASCVIWTFTSAPVPNCATGHLPADVATNVARNATLSWTAPSSPAASSYDIYLGTSTNPALVTNVTTVTYSPSLLLANTTYYWKVVSKNASGDAVGCIERSFATGSSLNYCTSTATNTADDDIAQVTFGSLINPVTAPSPLSSNAASNNLYTDFTALPVQNFMRATSYPIEVKQMNSGSYYTCWTKIFIDWNQDGDFDDVGEVYNATGGVDGPASAPANGVVFSSTITVPLTASLGNTRMRIILDESGSAISNPIGCGTFSWGETEDYLINVLPAPACVAPTDLASSNVAATTATLSWTASTSSPSNGYDIYYSTTNTAPLAGTTPTVNNHTLSSITLGELSSATTYYWWVRSDCGAETSAWASGGSFTTLCDLVTTFSQNWDGVTATALPICFNKVGTLGTVNTQAGSASSGTNTLYIYGGSTSSEPTLALQPVSNAGAGTHWLKFKLRANFTVGGKLQVGYLTNPTDATSFVMIQEFIANSATTYEEFKCIPGTLPGSNTTLALRAKGSPANSMLVDDLVWELAPSCLPPSELTATINSLNSATLSWTSEGTSFDIEWGTAGFAQGSGTVVNGVSNNHQLNGLTAETSYSFYVRQDCGSEQSTWAGPYTFYTGYCVPTGTSSSYRITGVATTGGYTNITNTANGTTLPYNNYSAMNVSQSPGGSISYTVNTPSSSGIKIWVDMNQNLVFDANELVASHLIYSSTGTWTGTLAVPEDLPLGNYRMRIRSGYYAYPDQIYACGSNYSNYGEAEDYTLSVVAPPSCLPVTNLSVVHTLTSANLSWTASTSVPSEGYEWEVRTSGAAGSGNEGLVSSGTTAAEVVTATATGLVLNTNHTLYVRANCGGNDFSVWAASAPFYVGYCVPVTSSGCTDGDVIARVVLNTLDNNSGTGCPSGTLGYSNYTTNPALTTTLQAGNSYSCTVYAGEFSEGYAAWIDYNNDGVFDNATERIGYSNGKVTGSGEEGVLGSSASFPVVISCNPTPGNYRLRVRAMFNTNGIDVTPCTANTYGETEDYMITISAAVACPQPNTLAATAINAQGATLNWNAGCEETLWDVHVGLAGSGSPAGAPSDASVTQAFVKTGLNHSTQYEYWVRANCGSGSVSDWSGPFAFTTTCPTGIWTGTTNTDWNTASNWTDGVVPAACTAVSITAANAVVIPSEVTVASLSIGATANVTVNGILNVGNIAVANGGIFTVANNAVVLQTPTAVNTGVTTVKVNSANLYRQDYTLWSSPVAGQNLRNFSPQTLFNRFSSYDTALGTVGDYVQEIVTTADMNTKTFVNAKGYMIRMPNNWTQFVNTSIPGTPYLGQFTGILNNGNVSIPLSQANTKLNLVGNPYPSPISISAFFAANPDINEVLYFWRKRNDAAGSGYATYNAMGLVSVQSDVNGLDMNNTIKPGQGFFVQSNTASTLNFNNSMRTSSQGTFLKGASATNELHRFWLNLSNTTSFVGQTLIGYATGATLGVDNGLDALYFNDSPLALTSLIDNLEYIIQGRSLPFTDTDIVPLGFKTDVAGSFTISLSNFDGLFADDQAIYLRDNTAGVVHNLKLSEYNFTTGSGIFNTRFEVLYSTTLGTNNPALTHNNILVGVKDQIIQINAGNVTMEKIELIDVSGRVIYTQDGVNATTATLDQVVANNQMLIVRIHTKESGIVTQKIIF